MDQLLQKIYEGATLYISNDSGFLAEFEKFAGVHVINSMKIPETCTMNLDGEEIEFSRTKRSYVRAAGAEVLAYDNLDMPPCCWRKILPLIPTGIKYMTR